MEVYYKKSLLKLKSNHCVHRVIVSLVASHKSGHMFGHMFWAKTKRMEITKYRTERSQKGCTHKNEADRPYNKYHEARHEYTNKNMRLTAILIYIIQWTKAMTSLRLSKRDV
jgi:hypothetical protein